MDLWLLPPMHLKRLLLPETEGSDDSPFYHSSPVRLKGTQNMQVYDFIITHRQSISGMQPVTHGVLTSSYLRLMAI